MYVNHKSLQKTLQGGMQEQNQELKQMVIQQQRQLVDYDLNQRYSIHQSCPIEIKASSGLVREAKQTSIEFDRLAHDYDQLLAQLVPLRTQYAEMVRRLERADRDRISQEQRYNQLLFEKNELLQKLGETRIELNAFKFRGENEDIGGFTKLDQIIPRLPRISPEEMKIAELGEALERAEAQRGKMESENALLYHTVDDLREKLKLTYNAVGAQSVFELQKLNEIQRETIESLRQKLGEIDQKYTEEAIQLNKTHLEEMSALRTSLSQEAEEQRLQMRREYDKSIQALEDTIQRERKLILGAAQDSAADGTAAHQTAQHITVENKTLRTQLIKATEKQQNLLVQLQATMESANEKQQNYERIITSLELKLQQKIQQLTQLQHEYNQLLLQFKGLEQDDIFLRADSLPHSATLQKVIARQKEIEMSGAQRQKQELQDAGRQFLDIVEDMEQQMNNMFAQAANQTKTSSMKQQQLGFFDDDEQDYQQQELESRTAEYHRQLEKTKADEKTLSLNDPVIDIEPEPKEEQPEEREDDTEYVTFVIRTQVKQQFKRLRLSFDDQEILDTNEQQATQELELHKDMIPDIRNIRVQLDDMELEMPFTLEQHALQFDGNEVLIAIE